MEGGRKGRWRKWREVEAVEAVEGVRGLVLSHVLLGLWTSLRLRGPKKEAGLHKVNLVFSWGLLGKSRCHIIVFIPWLLSA